MKPLLDRRRFAAFAALAGSGVVSPTARAATVWKLATGYGPTTFHTLNLQQMAREVESATGGELRIEIHPNNVLVKLADIRAATESGRIAAGETIMTSLIDSVPLAGADSVPFIIDSYADSQRLWRVQRPLIERHFVARGLQALYAVAWPPQGLFSTRPVAGIADLKGTRMRTYNATTARIAALVGAKPVDVPMVDIARALADGRIETMITSAITGVENQVWTHARHYYDIRAWFPKNIVFANLKAAQALTPSARSALLQSCSAAEARGWAASEAAAGSSLDQLRAHGIKVDRPSPELAQEIKRLGERFSLEWLRQVGAEANQIFIPYFART